MKNRIFVLLMAFLFCFFSINSFAIKPRWVGNTPKELNSSYRFVEVTSFGNDLASARMSAKQHLAQNEQLRRAVIVNVESGLIKEIDQTMVNGELEENLHSKVNINMSVHGKSYRLQANIVDEYIERQDGLIKLTTLYQVGLSDNVLFDNTRITTNYGAAPVVMSIIPGLGQIYKGSTVKGISMFAGTAACVVGAILCENTRADYKNKMYEQPEFAQKYNTDANNWQTARNICIGAAAAVWLYNIIDAAAAKGARKVIVKKANSRYFTFCPIATPKAAVLSMTYNF